MLLVPREVWAAVPSQGHRDGYFNLPRLESNQQASGAYPNGQVRSTVARVRMAWALHAASPPSWAKLVEPDGCVLLSACGCTCCFFFFVLISLYSGSAC